jgi:hypothetical protein
LSYSATWALDPRRCSRRTALRLSCGSWLAAGILVIGAGACGEGVESPQATPTKDSTLNKESTVAPGIERVQSTLTVAESVIHSSGSSLLEPTATLHRDNSNFWKVMNTSVAANTTVGKFEYACSPNIYSTWCPYQFTLGSGTSAYKGDPAVVSASRSSPRRLYHAGLTSNFDGFWFNRTQDPCPTAGGTCLAPTWDWSRHVLAGAGSSVDLPQLIYDEIHDNIWIVYRRGWIGPPAGSRLALARWSGSQAWGGNLSVFEDNCSNIATKSVDRVRAAFDISGNIHIVYINLTNSLVQHEVFFTDSNTFGCVNNKVGDISIPAVTCGCGLPTVPGTCVASFPIPVIAIDRASNPNNLVVMYESAGTGCGGGITELRFFRSTNYGFDTPIWPFVAVTSCQNNVMPNVAFAHTDGAMADTPGLAQAMSTFGVSAPSNYAQASWRTTDGGATWSGVQISPTRVLAPIPNTCFGSDYNGVVADRVTGSFFFSWGQPGTGVNWVTHGLVQNQ